MANIYTKIQRKVNAGLFRAPDYFLNALADEGFDLADGLNVVRRPFNSFIYTHDIDQTRYAFDGFDVYGDRELRVIVFIENELVWFKTAYWLK